jgi:hypothetical protein
MSELYDQWLRIIRPVTNLRVQYTKLAGLIMVLWCGVRCAVCCAVWQCHGVVLPVTAVPYQGISIISSIRPDEVTKRIIHHAQ